MTSPSSIPDDGDVLRYTAPQSISSAILGPCCIGWGLQLFLGGMATSLAGSLLLSKSSRVGRFSRPLLWSALLFNLVCMGVNWAELWDYMIRQQRDSETLNAYTLADALAPLPAGLTAAACQTYMAIRCLRITGRRVVTGVLVTSGIATSLAGAVWLTLENFKYRSGQASPANLLAPTQLWLWSAVATDLSITTILAYSLRKMKRGFNQSTDLFIKYLMHLAFGTFFAPCFFQVFTAIVYACTVRMEILWNLFNATAPCIPALYLISFCYCLSGTAAGHAKMESNSFRPTSAHSQQLNHTQVRRSGTRPSKSTPQLPRQGDVELSQVGGPNTFDVQMPRRFKRDSLDEDSEDDEPHVTFAEGDIPQTGVDIADQKDLVSSPAMDFWLGFDHYRNPTPRSREGRQTASARSQTRSLHAIVEDVESGLDVTDIRPGASKHGSGRAVLWSKALPDEEAADWPPVRRYSGLSEIRVEVVQETRVES